MSVTYTEKVTKLYGADPRELPLYGLHEAARYLKVSVATLTSWVKGRNYPLKDGTKRFWQPVIKLPGPDYSRLSFLNLVEVHVLLGIRRIHNIQFQKVRESIQYLEAANPKRKNILATEEFWTDKFDLFIENAGGLICTSQHGQTVIKEVVKQYLHRIERQFESPLRLYPFSTEIVLGTEGSSRPDVLAKQPKFIVIDPLISFGRPTIANTGIPTNVIAGRFLAGQSPKALAHEYGINEEQVEEALSYEGKLPRAA